jgi:alkanesulfonate monooxygenase SsuD/methylene tetrahydromethanopterin reductase-like flavin-dependent oxidoreductase (luciferase family)
VGRDYDEILQVAAPQILIAETEDELRRLQESSNVRPVSSNGIVGTPDQITEALQTAIRMGARRINVSFADSPRTDCTVLFSEQVLPHL